MEYTIYTLELQKTEMDDFVRVGNLKDFIREMGAINFSIQSERDTALELYRNIALEPCPYHKRKRFPMGDNDQFVDIFRDDWPRMLQLIRSAIGYKSPDTLDTNKNPQTNILTKASTESQGLREISEQRKAQHSFQNTIRKMQLQLSRTYLCRIIFEEKYGLQWGVALKPSEILGEAEETLEENPELLAE